MNLTRTNCVKQICLLSSMENQHLVDKEREISLWYFTLVRILMSCYVTWANNLVTYRPGETAMQYMCNWVIPWPPPHSLWFSLKWKGHSVGSCKGFLGAALSNVFKFSFADRIEQILRTSPDFTVLGIF